MKAEKADLVIHNATIYTADEEMPNGEAMAIKDGKVLEVGPEREIMNKYRADEFKDMGKRIVFPGFIDAHGHLHGLAQQYLSPDLSKSKSPEECIQLLKAFYKNHDGDWILGRGWDQTNWDMDSIPDHQFLTKAFPNRPVYITRVDGHAALVNQKAIESTSLNTDTLIKGGTLISRNGQFTGILIDNAMELVKNHIPDYSQKEWKQALRQAQEHLLSFGITTIADAGLYQNDLQRIIALNEEQELIIDVYGMLFPTKANYEWIKEHKKFQEGRLTVQSMKVIADGAMGSNGACMLEEYHDVHNHGKMLRSVEELSEIASLAKVWDYQLNVHCIGDSANRTVLEVMGKALEDMNDRRWRIEHAQIIHPDDVDYFKKYSIIPSVQPSHLMSDYRWLEQKLGKERSKRGYRYQTLKNANGIIAFGTDFPVEPVSPFRTFFAAVERTMENGQPIGGFLPSEKLSREETLLAMTRWAALTLFLDQQLGALSAGQKADFVVLDQNIMEVPAEKILKTHVIYTFKEGVQVYSGL